jgi:hypothetical protein
MLSQEPISMIASIFLCQWIFKSVLLMVFEGEQ